MTLVIVGGVMTVQAVNDQMYLRSDGVGGSWNDNLENWKFSKTWDGNQNQDVYELSIPANMISSTIKSLNFRLYREGTDYEVCPFQQKDYTFVFSNGQNETYNAVGDNFHGTSGAYKIDHEAIQASEYKITVYVKYNTPWEYYIKAEIVSMPAKIGPFGYTTFSCNRALDLSTVNNAYYVASNPTSSVKLVQTTGTVPAGEGLVLYGDPNAEITIPVAATTSANAIFGNLLKGCPNGASLTSSTSGYENVYVLVNTDQAEFQNVKDWLDGGNTLAIPAGKAYLQATGSGAPSFSIELGDETTGIMETVRETTTNNQYYTLDGRRVDQPTKGLYIVNGKKVIIK